MILNLDSTKAIHSLIYQQKSLNKTPMYSQNPCFFQFRRFLEVSEFSSLMKYTNTTPVHKKVVVWMKIIIVLLVYYLIFQQLLKGIYLNKFLIFSKVFFQNFCAVLGRVAMHNIAAQHCLLYLRNCSKAWINGCYLAHC